MAEEVMIGHLMKQIHDSMEKKANNDLRANGMTMMQILVLDRLDSEENKTLSMKDIERCFHIAQPTATGIVARLEQKGLVEALSDAKDRRVKLVRITSEGHEKCKKSSNEMKKADARIIKGFTDEEVRTLRDMLSRILENIG